MGVKNFLIDGVSGVGKTAVAEELERRRYNVIHGDRVLGYTGDPQTGKALKQPNIEPTAESVSWLNKHWIWPVKKIRALIADHSNPVTFFCGASRNSNLFIDLFDQVFVLDVDWQTLNQRLARRPEDEFGGRQVEKDLIKQLHITKQDNPKIAVLIDAGPPIGEVVDQILLKCGLVGKFSSER